LGHGLGLVAGLVGLGIAGVVLVLHHHELGIVVALFTMHPPHLTGVDAVHCLSCTAGHSRTQFDLLLVARHSWFDAVPESHRHAWLFSFPGTAVHTTGYALGFVIDDLGQLSPIHHTAGVDP